ncbi:hypothetical protein LO763_26955 [Glycomyces sp. A-F 0318]|uniref:general stress protein n=1 Tax=Glycomyces amatae TaxID=2881355 RepID=UPI001E385BDA|nr:general stress protein [Glycomyces amatae]MCD0447259.1 hypothetical protein [Glycomyces amatae]
MERSEYEHVEGGAGGAGQIAVGSYGGYAEAERVVDYLSDRQFPVERIAIVGQGLRSVEQVTGRLTMWSAAGRSAVSGAVLGALFGWIFGLLGWVDPLIAGLLLALYGAVFGAVVGGVAGLVAHALTGGRRDFSSVGSLQANSYDVFVEAAYAAEAIELLEAADAPGRGADRAAPAD